MVKEGTDVRELSPRTTPGDIALLSLDFGLLARWIWNLEISMNL